MEFHGPAGQSEHLAGSEAHDDDDDDDDDDATKLFNSSPQAPPMVVAEEVFVSFPYRLLDSRLHDSVAAAAERKHYCCHPFPPGPEFLWAAPFGWHRSSSSCSFT